MYKITYERIVFQTAFCNMTPRVDTLQYIIIKYIELFESTINNYNRIILNAFYFSNTGHFFFHLDNRIKMYTLNNLSIYNCINYTYNK